MNGEPSVETLLTIGENIAIERDEMFTENASKAIHPGAITPANLKPYSKNPIIAKFFHEIGRADELGSGVRNLYHYVKLYSGAEPVFDEEDIFRLTVPLNADYSPEKVHIEPNKVHIDPEKVHIGAEKPSIDTKKVSIGTEKVYIGAEKPSIDTKKVSIGTEKVSIETEKPSIDAKKPSVGPEKASIGTKKVSIDHAMLERVLDAKDLTRPTREHILALFDRFGSDIFGRSQIMDCVGLEITGAGKLLNAMLRLGLLDTVVGQGKGKYRFSLRKETRA